MRGEFTQKNFSDEDYVNVHCKIVYFSVSQRSIKTPMQKLEQMRNA